MPQFFLLFLLFLSFPAFAQLDITNGGGKQPVEITSDSLEMLQAQNKAIFSGDVHARQGDVDMRSRKMTVFYNKKGKGKNSGNVARIEITDDVFISTPKETAQGSRGIYDVEQGLITLEGNVILTSGKNVVNGQKLVYNLNTGQSKMVSASGAETTRKGRVKAVIIPGQ